MSKRRRAGARADDSSGTGRDESAAVTASAVLRRYARRADVPAVQDAELHRVADLLLRLGDLLVASGAATSDVEASVMASANALGVARAEVDVTFNAVTLTLVHSDGPPITQVRVVRHRAANYARLAAVHALVLELVDDGISRREATSRLGQIEEQRATYPRWVVAAAWGVLAAAVTQFLGGGLRVALVAFAVTVVVDQIGRLLSRRGWPDFFLNVAGGFVVTAATVGLRALDVPLRPSLVIAGGIIVMLSGVALVGMVQDAITGFLVTAAGRAIEVLLLSAGIVIGVALGLLVGQRLGVVLSIVPPVPTTLSDLPLRLIAAGIGAAAFAVAMQSPVRLLLSSALAGALSFAAWFTMLEWFSAPVAAGIAAVVAGLTSHVLALRLQAPPLVVVIPSIVILLPGLTIYRGMLLLSDGAAGTGLVTLLEAVTIGLALAAGVLLGEILGQPVRRELSRVERRIAGPHLIGPSRIRLRRTRRKAYGSPPPLPAPSPSPDVGGGEQ